jgi:2-hydroxychromene-2-carboxylate isomerase
MTTPIDFYFDFGSPYGYFASLQIEKLAAQYQRSINWHAILLGPAFKQMNVAALVNIPMKGDYARHDIQRTARFHDMPFSMPEVFPIGTQVAARAVLWSQQHDAGKAVDLIHALYRAYFSENINISDADKVLRIAADVGISSDRLSQALNDNLIKEQLKAEVERSLQRGVFGSPFMIVDGEAFWGFDRFEQLEAFLKNGKI